MPVQHISPFSITELISNGNLICQTHLVDELLKKDKHLDLFNDVYNLYEYTAELADGIFTGTVDQLGERLHALELGRDSLKERLHELEKQELITAEDHAALADITVFLRMHEEDITGLENAEEREKNICEWWLVPYWLSEMLIEKGEVAFRHFGCNWWGRTDFRELVFQDRILLRILDKMDNVVSGKNLNFE